MKTFLHLWEYLSQFFLEWDIFQIIFFLNSAIYETMWKSNGGSREATDDNIIRRIGFVCWVSEVIPARKRTHTQTHSHARRNM
jgi:hypothetical protein